MIYEWKTIIKTIQIKNVLNLQTPRGNNPPLKKKCSANAKQKPQENTHTEEWSPQSCICSSIEITPLHRLSPANRLHTHKTLFQKNISGGLLLYWYLISKLDFVKKNLLKVKTHETIDMLSLSYDCDHWKRLYT